ncbi:hypothetical protein [Paragemmobacter straminiformis]|uniref:Uncharacterized protein n=1 Tax=Paragemmobacter straminiformis TaxID=2045119 RepID=A0A842I5F9_9RHOB|nr:hypothetical protein [Gemmobacter straminiformis]MBC2835322.1 hypothetical protein [Gemmobacter straminiformis]
MSDAPALLAERLAGLAASRETVTYGALAAALGLRMAELTALLEATMEADAAAGRPLRAAVMEGKLSGGLPAKGFFDKAAGLGFDTSDPAGFTGQMRAALAVHPE